MCAVAAQRRKMMSESLICNSSFAGLSLNEVVSLVSTQTFSAVYSNGAQSFERTACDSPEEFLISAPNKLYFFTVGNVRGLVAHPSLVSNMSISFSFEEARQSFFSLNGRNSSYTIDRDLYGLANGKFAKMPIGATLSVSALNISCSVTINLYSITI